VPTKQGIGRDDDGHICQRFAPESLGFDGQADPLGLIEQDPFPALQVEQCVELVPIELDHLLLLPIDPTGENHDKQLSGV